MPPLHEICLALVIVTLLVAGFFVGPGCFWGAGFIAACWGLGKFIEGNMF